MVKIFRISAILLTSAPLIALICDLEVSDGRLLMIPQKNSKNLIEDALDNRNDNKCKVSLEISKNFNLTKFLN